MKCWFEIEQHKLTGGNDVYTFNAPYISRVKIKNFRNFKNVDVNLDHKQVIIGENNVGKTNFLRAIQLILDPNLSDEDRYLVETDFYDGLDSPLETGEEVEITIDIRGYSHNRVLLATLSDATVSDSPPTLRFTYHYYAIQNPDGTYKYEYRIYQGKQEDIAFTHYHRRYLNIKVINAIRDVESEMRNTKKSPINLLLKDYDIKKEELESIASGLKEKSDEVLSIDELVDLTEKINQRFINTIGNQVDADISLSTINYDPNRILSTLKLMIGKGKRPTSDTSLGLNNILYISLILLSLEDKTIPSILKKEAYMNLIEEEESEILGEFYQENDKGNYILNNDISEENNNLLYDFMDRNMSTGKGVTILAIEEPESHLHPSLQRIIYKDVMKKNTSVLMTTHSPYITSVSPINSIVHLRSAEVGTTVKTTASLELNQRDKKDLERYVDIKKGEIYFGKGVVLVEGMAEEYLIPKFAELLGYSLDKEGIICCNINSTNFKPYVQFLEALGVPFVVITDGDYYYHNEKKEKIFGSMWQDSHENFGYDGYDRIKKILIDLGYLNNEEIPDDSIKQKKIFSDYGYYVGVYTLEIDMMSQPKKEKDLDVFHELFKELTQGGEQQKMNFKNSLIEYDFVTCLRKIESRHSQIGKGRFAQALSMECEEQHIPDYIKEAIQSISEKVCKL